MAVNHRKCWAERREPVPWWPSMAHGNPVVGGFFLLFETGFGHPRWCRVDGGGDGRPPRTDDGPEGFILR